MNTIPSGKNLKKMEQKLFGKDGFETMVGKVAAIEKTLGIYELAQFTPNCDAGV